MDNRLSKMAYLNIFIVCLIMIFHEIMEAINHWLIYFVLIAYAIINVFIIQVILYHEKKLKKEVHDKARLSDLVAQSVPSGIVIINSKGIIEYLNESIVHILGSGDTVGMNILEFNTVKASLMYPALMRAIQGETVSFKDIEYISYTTGIRKVLNILTIPLEKDLPSSFFRIMLFVTDVTYENELLIRLENQYLNMFKSFAKFIDAKDVYTGYHSSQVHNYTELIINHMEMDETLKKEILIAASLHDIGKVGIGDEILNKPGRLTKEEYEAIKAHSTIGATLLDEIDGYEGIAQMIKHHHERFDGHGYPDGLKGHAIPIGSQIICVADAYDAITSDRIYKKARSKEEAIGILRDACNSQFNKEIVDIFISILNESEQVF